MRAESGADETRSRRWRIAAAALGASGPVVGVLLGLGALWPAAALHVGAALAAWRLWRRPGPGGADLALVATTLAACFPVVGSVGAWWVYGRPEERQSGLVDAYRAYIGRNWNAQTDVVPLADPNRALTREVAVLPLGDQLSTADLAGKQAAAAALQRMEGAGGVKILRDALVHPADDTRLMASLALLKKEEALVAELKAARTRAEVRPDTEARLGLAAVARRYAESGLSATGAAEALWRECAREARAALRAASPAASRTALNHLAAAHLALGEPEQALEAADAAIAQFPVHEVSAASAEDVAIHLMRLQSLFALGRAHELAEPARALVALAEPGTDAHAQASFWSGYEG
jgi:hypothetical protein